MALTVSPSELIRAPATANASVAAPRRRRVVLKLFAGSILLLAAAIGVAASLGLRTPGWYHLPKVHTDDRQHVRNNLLAAEQAMTESLRRGQTFVYQLPQEDLNRWLVMRREIYPLADEFTPPELSDPFVAFTPGCITVAGRIRRGSWSVIASIDVEPVFRDGEIVLTARAARCGSLPVPLRSVGLALGRHIDRKPGKSWPGSPRIWGDLIRGVHLESKAWWKNGGKDYEVLNVWVDEGALKFEIRPLGGHFAATQKDHAD